MIAEQQEASTRNDEYYQKLANGKSRRRKLGFSVAIGGVCAVAASLLFAGSKSDEARMAKREGNIRVDTALALGRAGFTDVVTVQMYTENRLQATVNADPANPKACSIVFDVINLAEGHPLLSKPELDSAGKTYGWVTLHNGGEAQTYMAAPNRCGEQIQPSGS